MLLIYSDSLAIIKQTNHHSSCIGPPTLCPEWRFNIEVNWNRLPRDGRFVLTTCWGHPCRFHRCRGYWGRRSRPWRGPGLRLAMWPPPGRHTNQPLGITHHTISSAIITLRFSGVHIEFQRGGILEFEWNHTGPSVGPGASPWRVCGILV